MFREGRIHTIKHSIAKLLFKRVDHSFAFAFFIGTFVLSFDETDGDIQHSFDSVGQHYHRVFFLLDWLNVRHHHQEKL